VPISSFRPGPAALVAAALAVCALTIFCKTADADTTRVVLVVEGDETSLVRRLMAELEMLGFEVESIRYEIGSNPQKALGNAARQARAEAAVHIITSQSEVDVWVANRITDKAVLRRVKNSDDEDNFSLVAVAAVELLRASLMEIETAVKPSEKSTASAEDTESEATDEAPVQEPEEEPDEAPDEEPDEASSDPPDDAAEEEPGDAPRDPAVEQPTSGHAAAQLSLQAGPAVTAGGFDSGPMINVLLGVHFRLVDLLGLSLLGLTPLIPSKLDEPAGKASVNFGMVGGGVELSPAYLSHRLRPCLTAGFAAVFFNFDGSSDDSSFVANEELVAMGAPFLRGGLGFELTSALQVRLDVLAGWTLSKAIARMNNTDVAVFGNLVIAGAIALDLSVW
jgi:hypothetical protein